MGTTPSDGDDELFGASVPGFDYFNDLIHALGGDDIVHGLNGNDWLNGGVGSDRLFGDGGNDALNGGDSDEFVSRDTLDGGSGNDELRGGPGGDRLYGGSGADLIVLLDSPKKARIDGGSGVDRLEVNLWSADAGVRLEIPADPSAIVKAGGFRFVAIEALTARGSDFGDTLSGGRFADLLDGAAGKDVLAGGRGSDTIDGGTGNDRISGGRGDDQLSGGREEVDRDRISGGSGSDVISGSRGNDRLAGDSGDDNIIGWDGDDLVSGGDGDDQLSGFTGADTVHGGNGDDRLETGSASSDSDARSELRGDDGDDFVDVVERSDAAGGRGIDTIRIDLVGTADAVALVMSEAFAVGTITAREFERVEFHAGSGADSLTGGLLDDAFYGRDGADTLTSGAGKVGDTLDGGMGDDRLTGGDGADLFSDVIEGSLVSETGVIDSGADTFRGGRGDDVFLGLNGANVFEGGRGNDLFRLDEGFGTNQKIDGGKGYDTVSYTALAPQPYVFYVPAIIDLADQSRNGGIATGSRFRRVESFVGTWLDDTLLGATAGERLDGGRGDDRLDGRSGDDVLIGGFGNDELTGGDGNDVFVLEDAFGDENGFPRLSDALLDVVTDFTSGSDRLLLDLSGYGLTRARDLTISSGNDPAPTSGNAALLFDSATHELVFDADGTGGSDDGVLIATLTGLDTLSLSDFILVA